MDKIVRVFNFKNLKKNSTWIISLMGMFFVLHAGIPIYINSAFLSAFTGEQFVGIIFTIASFLSILGIIATTKSIEKFGDYKTMVFLILLEIIALVGMIVLNKLVLIIPAFFIHFIFNFTFGMNIDVLLEHNSKDQKTGAIRGAYLTLNNFAWVIVPILAGFMVGKNNYWKVYLASLVFLIPLVFLLNSNFRKFRDPKYERLKLWKTFMRVQKDKNIKNIFIVSVIMRIFFAVMVIYTPIYLLNHIGFSFSEMGIILTVALSAYLFLEYPLGKLSDTKFGEKEILTAGFVVLAITTVVISYITSTSLAVWSLALFGTRIGAAMIESMSETYFFKNTNSSDTDILSFFRTAGPVAYLIAPTLGSLFLIFFDLKYIFLATGIFVLVGLKYSLSIKDTN
ncbi:MFS transporter [Patescibacteria group bacterium]|nr:MFS transporter [Patescibacteria group bacterium]MBU4116030.1 MFS transporter [Patescibacteria group bacterium]